MVYEAKMLVNWVLHAGLLVWLRFVATRQLIWNKNYNVKPQYNSCGNLPHAFVRLLNFSMFPPIPSLVEARHGCLHDAHPTERSTYSTLKVSQSFSIPHKQD